MAKSAWHDQVVLMCRSTRAIVPAVLLAVALLPSIGGSPASATEIRRLAVFTAAGIVGAIEDWINLILSTVCSHCCSRRRRRGGSEAVTVSHHGDTTTELQETAHLLVCGMSMQVGHGVTMMRTAAPRPCCWTASLMRSRGTTSSTS